MPPLPRLSVILPNYNHAVHLPTCLTRLLNQTPAPFEIVAIDDGSSDNSWEILGDFARNHPTLKIYRNEKNRGVARTVNRGIELAQGEYLFMTASDDFVLPGLFEKSLRLLAQYPQAGLSCTICEWRYVESGLTWHMAVGMADRPSYLSPDDLVRVGRRGKLAISSSSMIVRRDAVMNVGLYVPDLLWHCDWFFNTACALRYGLCFVPEPLSQVNIHPHSHYTSGRKKPQHRQVLRRIMDLFNTPAFDDIRPRVRDSAALSVFATPMLKILLSRPEYRYYLNGTFLRWMLWRNAELTGSKILPLWLARWFTSRLYRHSSES